MATLTPAQLVTLRADLATRRQVGGPLAGVTDLFQIAEWYNKPIDNTEGFAAPTLVWKPRVTLAELSSVIDWSVSPVVTGTPASETERLLQINNSWLKWQSMTWDWSAGLDMTDSQVRAGVTSIWGSGAGSVGVAITNKGRRPATRAEYLFATATAGGARVTPYFGQSIDMQDAENALAT